MTDEDPTENIRLRRFSLKRLTCLALFGGGFVFPVAHALVLMVDFERFRLRTCSSISARIFVCDLSVLTSSLPIGPRDSLPSRYSLLHSRGPRFSFSRPAGDQVAPQFLQRLPGCGTPIEECGV